MEDNIPRRLEFPHGSSVSSSDHPEDLAPKAIPLSSADWTPLRCEGVLIPTDIWQKNIDIAFSTLYTEGVSSTLNISLTDELRAFVDSSCGDGTLYATPSEFVRDLIRQNKERRDAEAIRQGILDGYQDALQGRVTLFEGDLRGAMRSHKSKRGK